MEWFSLIWETYVGIMYWILGTGLIYFIAGMMTFFTIIGFYILLHNFTRGFIDGFNKKRKERIRDREIKEGIDDMLGEN